MKNNKELDRISKIILKVSIDVHKEIGPGLLESIYHLCLIKELLNKGIMFSSSVRIPLIYKGTSPRDYQRKVLSVTRIETKIEM